MSQFYLQDCNSVKAKLDQVKYWKASEQMNSDFPSLICD